MSKPVLATLSELEILHLLAHHVMCWTPAPEEGNAYYRDQFGQLFFLWTGTLNSKQYAFGDEEIVWNPLKRKFSTGFILEAMGNGGFSWYKDESKVAFGKRVPSPPDPNLKMFHALFGKGDVLAWTPAEYGEGLECPDWQHAMCWAALRALEVAE